METQRRHRGHDIRDAHALLAEVKSDEEGSDDGWLLIAGASGSHYLETVVLKKCQTLKLHLADNVLRALVVAMAIENGPIKGKR